MGAGIIIVMSIMCICQGREHPVYCHLKAAHIVDRIPSDSSSSSAYAGPASVIHSPAHPLHNQCSFMRLWRRGGRGGGGAAADS